jgi:hypothetical protein
MKAYQALAQKLEAIANCERSGKTKWRETHCAALQAIVREAMPSGSGFDAGTDLDPSSTSQKLIFNTSFHYMDENGYYDGWTGHRIIATPCLARGFDLRVTGRDRNGAKDFIADAFNHALNTEVQP